MLGIVYHARAGIKTFGVVLSNKNVSAPRAENSFTSVQFRYFTTNVISLSAGVVTGLHTR